MIFISAASDIADKVKAFEEGGVDYITKPFQKEEVIARVKTQIALSHNIQRLKKASVALQKSEESLRLAQTIAELGHWEWDINSGEFVCSEEMHRILGIEASKGVSSYEAFLQAIHPDDREKVAIHLKNVFSGDNFDIEFRVMSHKGDMRIVRSKGKLLATIDDTKKRAIGIIHDIHSTSHSKLLGVVQDITESKELQNKLEGLANTDVLTGCDSRRHFLEESEQELLRSRRYGREMSMLMLDLDHFKNINDQHGHQAGDEVLRKFVATCQTQLREVDVTGRLGGEEFAIMLPETGITLATEIAERLAHAVAGAEVLINNATPIHFTTSIGVASLAESDLHIDTLLIRADGALYKAKQAGRNRVCA